MTSGFSFSYSSLAGRQYLDSGVVVDLLPDLILVDLVDPGWPVLGPVLLPVLRAGALDRLRPVRQLSQILFLKKPRISQYILAYTGYTIFTTCNARKVL